MMSDSPDVLIPRSLLFVPGDSERKQAKAVASNADALILDLEDSVAPVHLPKARTQVCEFLQALPTGTRQQLWVRVNSLSSGKLLDDLTSIIPGKPYGFVLPKVSSPVEVIEVDHYLSALEVREGRARGSTRLIVIATETPKALLTLHGYQAPLPRLGGLTWGPEDLATALGATSNLEPDGSLAFTFQLARSMCLVAAAAAAVAAFDSIYPSFRDLEGLASAAARARRDGFAGKLAIHPDQVAVINAAFAPTATEIAQAGRIVAAFAASPDSGALSIDGHMIDRPHLMQAERILDLAKTAGILADPQ